MKIAEIQAGKQAHQLPYIRIPVGESFSPYKLSSARLASRGLCEEVEGYAYHLDLGHVPPPDCNVFLFQLLLEGCVRRVARDDDGETFLVYGIRVLGRSRAVFYPTLSSRVCPPPPLNVQIWRCNVDVMALFYAAFP